MRPTLLRLSLLAGLLPAISGCELVDKELRFLVTEHRQFSPEQLAEIIGDQTGLEITQAEVEPGRDPVAAIRDREADLALVENSVTFLPGIRAVIPVYESVLHIANDPDYEPADTESPLRGASFYVANGSVAGRAFVELVIKRQELSLDDVQITAEFVAGETDFIIYFGPIDPGNVNWMRPGYVLGSLDNELNPKRKFYEEAISYNAPRLTPKVIPAFTYDLPGNEEPLLSVSVDTLLVTHKDISEAAIYELARVLLEQKTRFTAIAPQLFAGINESFDPLDLNFPLHRGARAYLERDDPGFIERYAETINMLVYVSFLMISAVLAFARWRDRVKKDRIDVFYARVLVIRDEPGKRTAEERLAELDALEREAFESLISEKLSANESFRIFTDLLRQTREEIHKARPSRKV
jgi:TRAP-type uncharacterized transport system substrate-binding protein